MQKWQAHVRFHPFVSNRQRLQHLISALPVVARMGVNEPQLMDAAKRLTGRFEPTAKLLQAYRRSSGEGLRNREVYRAAVEMVRTAPPHAQLAEIQNIVGWVQRNIRYVMDPYKVEMFKSPGTILKDRAGDCDCMVTLTSALVSSVGYPSAAIIVDSQGDGVMNHVIAGVRPYTAKPEMIEAIRKMVIVQDKKTGWWIPVELTLGQMPIGTLTRNFSRYIVVEVG